MDTSTFWSIVREVIFIGGGAAAISYGIFTYLGKKWLDSKFAERLEAFKHEQNLQMEQYRFEISSLFSRVTKIHDKEFEVLPATWLKLQDALGRVAKLTSALQYSPDLNKMDQEQLEETLAKTEFSESQKKIIWQAPDKTQAYIKAIFWYDLDDAKEHLKSFHNDLINNKIFLSKDLFEDFTQVDKLLSTAIMKREILQSTNDYQTAIPAFREIISEVKVVIDRIEENIQKRLHYMEAG